VLFGLFALIYNKGKQLINAGVKGVKFLIHRGKFLVYRGKFLIHRGKTIIHITMKRINAGIEMLKTAVHLMLKMLNFSVEFFGALINDFVNDFQRNFFNCGMNEVFHIENVYHMNARSSNGLLFTHGKIPDPALTRDPCYLTFRRKEPRGIDAFLFIFLDFLAGMMLIRPGFLQGAPDASTQTNPDVRLRSVPTFTLIGTLRRDWRMGPPPAQPQPFPWQPVTTFTTPKAPAALTRARRWMLLSRAPAAGEKNAGEIRD
jgi:hypothetical protein